MSVLSSCTTYNPEQPLHRQLEKAYPATHVDAELVGMPCRVSVVQFKPLKVAGLLFHLSLTRMVSPIVREYVFTIRPEGSQGVVEAVAERIEGIIAELHKQQTTRCSIG